MNTQFDLEFADLKESISNSIDALKAMIIDKCVGSENIHPDAMRELHTMLQVLIGQHYMLNHRWKSLSE